MCYIDFLLGRKPRPLLLAAAAVLMLAFANTAYAQDATGHIDTNGDLIVQNPFATWGGGHDEPKTLVYHATPAGQLPACDSAEVVEILARITASTLDGIFTPKALGSNNGKNICAVGIGRWSGWNNPKSYTVEWLDQAKGTYWVQITGTLR